MQLRHKLTAYTLTDSAERVATQHILSWINFKLNSWPWDTVQRSNNMEREYLAAKRRIHKKQTGNNIGYGNFIRWYESWKVIYHKPNSHESSILTEQLLAFPTGNSFEEKVFEIWCLKVVVNALQLDGFTIISGPKPLHKKDLTPIYILSKSNMMVNVWFQKQGALGTPKWFYTDTRTALRGVPDIVLTSPQLKAPLVVDAKWRFLGTSRSEETYKMLGYYENFRCSWTMPAFFGILIFISDSLKQRKVEGPGNSFISSISIPLTESKNRHFLESLKTILLEWQHLAA